jgi:hypothetical protein
LWKKIQKSEQKRLRKKEEEKIKKKIREKFNKQKTILFPLTASGSPI